MIQDIGKDIYHVEYRPEKPEEKDVVFAFKTRRVFAKMDEKALNPYRGKYQGQRGATGSRVFMDKEIK